MALLVARFIRKVIVKLIKTCPEVFDVGKSNTESEYRYICDYLTMSSEGHGIARGYYGLPTYPAYISGFDPLTVLAGLAFLAFLLQTLYALLYRTPQPSAITPVAVSRSVSPGISDLMDRVLRAIQKYDELNNQHEQDSSWFLPYLKAVSGFMSNLWFSAQNKTCFEKSCKFLRYYNEKIKQ
ncbi:uncharacterized protein LOC126481111 [Schistocerca serialis cubense]|uniref:uncharacterized protein LOC126481111 n=2 Tax=Schistocerca TaxID=7008 RepID=UPI00214F0091|nr:uncharacterized protein LOC126481111 [Schistocerca serialis cubense]XP_049960594.1 uncharacterized protein LOC126481111 [Schistocerca serialis cubense]XP_049960595.1 uncharacterized protein LOC126481111 [Schistocerca serialis cubense]XP_049960596.1 uncharacterized protein LOC126481111 [Schistocerca serialis cubense]XP_049960597.1 uncharacterized protein LOC126481111 [Schistocerca serialis cubense]XP_049960598.1 uncharacterized protein LOC126481111 [Schistocerca serialis cubense]XP_04996059